jgi:hypothetical protein
LGLVQFLGGTIVVLRAIRGSRPVVDRQWLALLASESAQLGVGRTVAVRATAAVSVPVVWGWRKPVILVPASSQSWPTKQRRALLRHELAHVARHDCLAQAVAIVAQAVYWPHPLVWWAARRLRAEAERACDDLVLAAGTKAPEYAEYLLEAARALRESWHPSSSSAVVERTHLYDRLRALLDEDRNRGSVGRRGAALASGVVLAGVALLAALQPAVRAAAAKAALVAMSPLSTAAVPGAPVNKPPAPGKAESVLAGTVRGPDGKPVEAALVIAKSSREGVPPMTSTTAADGAFRLLLPSQIAGTWDVTVEARALAAVTLERVRVGAPLVVSLEKGGAIDGTVRDGTDGRPLKGVRVSAAAPSSLRYALPWLPTVGLVEAETDREGRFHLEGMARGLFEVSARAPRYGGAQRRNVRAGSNVDLLLFPGASILGTVRGLGQRPIAGAVVVAARLERDGWMRAGAEATDSRGNFVFAGPKPGSYLLMARHPELAPTLLEVEVVALAESRVDFALGRGTPVMGRLVDDQDRPRAGKVGFEAMGGHPVPRHLADTLKVEAGPDGVFVLERVAPGNYDLGVTASGLTSRRLELDVGPREKAVDLGKIVLEPGLTIRGRAVDRAGGPVAAASLYAWPVSGSTFGLDGISSSSPDPVLSEADGRFVIGGLAGGTYNVTAAAPGYVTEAQQTEAGADKPVRLVLAPGGTVTGAVVDGRRRPVEAFTVTAERVENGLSGYGVRASKEVASADGRFTLDGLAEGTYVVGARAPETAPGRRSGVKVVGGRVSDAGTIRLGAGGAVRGSVVDSAGAGVAGAVLLAFVPGPAAWRDRAESQSDSSGQFEMTGVPVGRVTVTATHPSYAESRVADLEVEPARGPAEARIILSAGGRVEGTARKRDGTALPGLVSVTRRSNEPEGLVFPGTATVQSDGSFSLDHVAAGPVTVSLLAKPSAGVSLGVETREVVVVEGQSTSVDFTSRELRVSGRVTRGDQALPGVRVVLRPMPFSMTMSGSSVGGIVSPRAGLRLLEGVTNADGAYELLALRPGQTWAEVVSLDGRTQYASRELDVPDVESHTFDIKLRGVPVSGRLVDKDTGAAVGRGNVHAAARKGDEYGGASTGPDGAFALELAPGDYKVSASAEGYAPLESAILSVPEAGTSDVRLELSRGQVLEGKVVDLAGRPVAAAQVYPSSGESSSWLGMAVSLEDGSFRLERLPSRPYTLTTGSPASGFAISTGVSPGDKDVVLTLRPGGRVRIKVKDPTGSPVARASPSIVSVDGSRVRLFAPTGMTDQEGVVEFGCPAGAIEIRVDTGRLGGTTTIQVEAGAVAATELVIGSSGGP